MMFHYRRCSSGRNVSMTSSGEKKSPVRSSKTEVGLKMFTSLPKFLKIFLMGPTTEQRFFRFFFKFCVSRRCLSYFTCST